MAQLSTHPNRHFIDVNTLKQVEIVPGPSSSLYGSDAMGGTVAYTTKDPSDIYKGVGDGVAGGVNLRYNSGDEGFSKSIEAAGRSGNIEAMVIVTHRNSAEMENTGEVEGQGPTREVADPEDNEDNNILAKVLFNLDEDQKIKLTGEHVHSDEYTDAFASGNGTTSSDYKYDDEKEKTRLSAEYGLSHTTSVFDEMHAKLDWQSTDNDQLTSYTSRGSARTYDSDYGETVLALDLNFTKNIASGHMAHKITYGLNAERQTFAQWRDSSSSGVARGMPESEGESYAVYLQDQLTFGDSGFSIVPGVRYDKYTISPKPDADYLANNPADPDPDDNTGDQVSFKLGATYDFDDTNSVFAQFAQGYKAPDMDQLYENYDRAGRYKGLANPDLKPESVDALELGYRFIGDVADAEIVMFYNEYTDFIDQVTLNPNPDPANYPFGIFQDQNLNDVRIRGVEFKGSYDISDEISLKGALAYAKGTYKQASGDSSPLNTIAPMHGTVSLAYDDPSDKWGSELTVTASQGKKEKDIDTSDYSGDLVPAGYAAFDLTGYYDVSKDLRINAGVFNMFDKKYYEWENVRDNSVKPEAARHFKVALTYRF